MRMDGRRPFRQVACFIWCTVFTIFGSCRTIRAQSQSDSSIRNTSAKQPFTVADSIQMTRFGDPLYDAGADSKGKVAQFSPDGKHFVVLIKHGNLSNNTNDYSMLLFQTIHVFESPTPQVIISFSSSSNRPGIQRIKWLDNETIMFLAENPSEHQQLYSLNFITGKLEQLTHHPTNLLTYVINPKSWRCFFVAEPSVTSLGREKYQRQGIAPGDSYSLVDLIAQDDSAQIRYRRPMEIFSQVRGELSETVFHVADKVLAGESWELWLSPDGRHLVVQG